MRSFYSKWDWREDRESEVLCKTKDAFMTGAEIIRKRRSLTFLILKLCFLHAEIMSLSFTHHYTLSRWSKCNVLFFGLAIDQVRISSRVNKYRNYQAYVRWFKSQVAVATVSGPLGKAMNSCYWVHIRQTVATRYVFLFSHFFLTVIVLRVSGESPK